MTRRTWQLTLALTALCLVVSLPAAARAQRKVLLADPALSEDVPLPLAGELATNVRQSIERAGAQPLAAADVQERMQQSGVASLVSREDTVKVARLVGADSVLRYQARMEGEKLQVTISVFFTDAGKAVMLERSMAIGESQGVVGAMVAEILGPPPPPGPTPPGPTPPGPTPTSQPTEAPAPASPPDPERWAAGPRAARGVALGFHVGGSIPLGGGETDEFIETDLRIGMHAGYQLRMGERHALVPELALQQSSWSFKDGTVVNLPTGQLLITGGLNVLHLMPGVRYLLFFGPVELFAAAHVGLAYATQTIANANDPSDKVEDTATGWGFDVGTGAHFMFLKWLGAGLFLDVSKSFVDIEGSDYDALALGIGLSVKGKIPF